MSPTSPRAQVVLLVAVAMTALTAGCGGPGSPPGVATLELSPVEASVKIGERQTFTVVSKDAAGRPVSGVTLRWTSSNETVAAVTDGVATGRAAGETEITASAGGVTSNRATLTVTVAERPSSLRLIDDALARGEIDADLALRYKVFAVFGDGRLPASYRGDDEGRDGTLLMTALAADFAGLPPATQDVLEPYLKAPSEPGSWLERAEGAALESQAIVWGTVVTHNDKVKVWYEERWAGDDLRARHIADALDATIWPKLTGLMREPLPDCGATCPEGGGDPRLDIYLVDIARSYTQPGSGVGATSTYIVLRHDAPFTSVVHELMHAIEFAYPMASSDEYDWLVEATAQWAVDWVYPATNGDPDYPEEQIEQAAAVDFLGAPHTPLETTDDAHEYGAYLLPFFLAGKGRTGAGAVRSLWEHATLASSLAAVDAAVAGRGGLAEVWPQFALANWNREPVGDYRDWDGLRDGASPATSYVVGAVGVDEVPTDAPHLSALYTTFAFTSERIRSVVVDNPFASGGDPAARLQAIVKIGGRWRPPEDWTTLSRKKFCREKPDEHLEELVLIVSNSAWQDRSHVLTAGPLKVEARAQGCSCAAAEVTQWTGQAGFSYDVLADDGSSRLSRSAQADVSAIIRSSAFGGSGELTGAATLDALHQDYDPQGGLHFGSSIEGSGSPIPAPFHDDASVMALVIDPVACRYTLGVRVYIDATATDILGATTAVEAHVGAFSTAWRPLPDSLLLMGDGAFPVHSSPYIEGLPDLADGFLLDDFAIRSILGEDGMGTATVSWSVRPVAPPPTP